jgi:1-acyl-sn-glycerol-3-phosphate acyltransferase
VAKQYQFNWDRIAPYKFYNIAMPVSRVLAWVLFRMRVEGRENLPESTGGVILACNHLHSIDPGLLVACSRRKWRFIAKKELYKHYAVALLFTHCNAFPIDRDTVDRRALDFALRVMEDERYGLGIFPEGQRSSDGMPQEAKAGIAMLARQTKADVLPCTIYHEGKLRFRKKITVRFGQVIPFAELGLGDAPNKRQSREACEKIMKAIQALWKKGHD